MVVALYYHMHLRCYHNSSCTWKGADRIAPALFEGLVQLSRREPFTIPTAEAIVTQCASEHPVVNMQESEQMVPSGPSRQKPGVGAAALNAGVAAVPVGGWDVLQVCSLLEPCCAILALVIRPYLKKDWCWQNAAPVQKSYGRLSLLLQACCMSSHL